MPPERRRSRTKPDRNAGPKPGTKARPGSGGTTRKAVRSSQRTPQAGQRAESVVTAVTEEEESRLRQRNRRTLEEEDKPDAERCLEQLVFGDVEDDEDALLRRLRSSRGQLHESSDDSEVDDEAKDNLPHQKKPVWVDDDDEDEEIVDMLNNRFRKDIMKNASESKLSKDKLQKRLKEEFQHAMGGVPDWAEPGRKKRQSSDDESEEDEDDLLQRTGNFISTSTSLPRGILKMKNCRPANAERPTTARISSVQFHPGAQVVMVSGVDNAISLFQVDGKTNPKIQSIYLEKFPIFKACFSANGEELLATSMHSKVLYVYDMLAGKLIPVHQVRGLKEKIVKRFEVSPNGSFLLISGIAGFSHLLSMKTKELIGSMKINGRIAASSFSSDSKRIYTSSGNGEVYVWDVNSRKCINRFLDEGSLCGLSIATSKNGQYVACGSKSGVVNIYSQDSCLQQTNPKPIKAIMNLVTGATSLAFNPTTEILAVASKRMKDAVRLVHLPSCTVFSNFPVFKKSILSRVQTMDFSPRSGYFALGNERGKALLYRLHHFSDF
ncbi:U3 small nucleolar RNA-associated protein 18-like [Sigmodon hispidus]